MRVREAFESRVIERFGSSGFTHTRVEVATRDERTQLGEGEAVEWQEGEWHETRSLQASTLLLVEGAFE